MREQNRKRNKIKKIFGYKQNYPNSKNVKIIQKIKLISIPGRKKECG